MIRKSTVSILLLSIVAFLGGMVGSLGARSGEEIVGPTEPPSPRHPLGRCLKLDPERRARIAALDPTFFDDLADLREELATQRRELAGLLESGESTDEDIRDCVERSIEIHNRLERRVLEHLLLVRPMLTPEEQKRLFRSLSKRIRGHGRRFGRHRGPDGQEGAPDCAGPPRRERGHFRGDPDGPRWRGEGNDDDRKGRGRGWHRRGRGQSNQGADEPPPPGPDMESSEE